MSSAGIGTADFVCNIYRFFRWIYRLFVNSTDEPVKSTKMSVRITDFSFFLKSAILTDMSVDFTVSSVELKTICESNRKICKYYQKNLLSLFQQMTSVDSTVFFLRVVAVCVSLWQPQKVYRSDTHTVELRKRHGGVAASIRKVYLRR